MRKLILLSLGVATAAMLGVTVVDAQRPDRPRRDQARFAQNAGDAGQVGAPVGQRGRRGGPPLAVRGGRGGPGGGVLFGLELSDDQREAIQDLQRSARDASAETGDALQSARHSLHRAIFADERDDAAVAELAAEVARLDQVMADAQLQTQLAIADLLTAEQKEIVRTRPQAGRGGRGVGPRR